MGACSLRKVHVFSDSVFCTDPGSLNSTSASNKWNNGRTSHEKGTLARTQAILRWRRFKLNGTHVLETHRCRYCNIYKFSCRRPGTYPRVFQTESFFTSTFNDITDHASKKVQGKCLDSAKEVASEEARFSPGYCCFSGPESEQTSQDLLLNGLTERRTILLLRRQVNLSPANILCSSVQTRFKQGH